MKIPSKALIPKEKLTRYLLVYKARNDKSKFLAKAGFTPENPESLQAAIRSLAESAEAIEDGVNEYGRFYRAEGELTGASGVILPVVTIWLERQVDGQFQFITLKPRKESRYDP